MDAARVELEQKAAEQATLLEASRTAAEDKDKQLHAMSESREKLEQEAAEVARQLLESKELAEQKDAEQSVDGQGHPEE